LFTFRDTEEDAEFYKWSGYNDHIQFSDDKSIAIGGADGKFALYIRNNLYNGVTNKCKTYNNEILASSSEFE
jgi:predicted lactoylglutathione lyase